MARRRPGQRIAEQERTTAQGIFIKAFAERGNVKAACAAAGIESRQTVYVWRKDDPAFSALWDEAEQDANDLIRAEIWRRGVTGWDEMETVTETTDDGLKVKTKTVHRYDTNLLRLLASSRMPEYKDRLDVTTGDDKLTNYEALLHDPIAAEHAARLVERVAGYGIDTSGPSVDSEQ